MKVILEIIWVSGHPYYDQRNQLVDYLVVILGGKHAAYKTRNERDCTQTSQKWQDPKTQIKLTISLLQKTWERSSETGPFDFKIIMTVIEFKDMICGTFRIAQVVLVLPD